MSEGRKREFRRRRRERERVISETESECDPRSKKNQSLERSVSVGFNHFPFHTEPSRTYLSVPLLLRHSRKQRTRVSLLPSLSSSWIRSHRLCPIANMSRVHPAGDGDSPGIRTQKSMFQKSIENAPNSAISFVATSTSFLLGLLFALVWMSEMLFLMYAFPATTNLWTMSRVGATWRHPANGSYVYMSKTEEWARELSGEANPTCMQDVQFSTFPNITSEFMVAYGTVRARAFAKSCGGGATTQYTSVEEEANAAAFERYMDLRVHFGESNSSENRNDARQIWESDEIQCNCKIIDVVANSPLGEWFIKDFFIGTNEDNVDAINGWHNAIKLKRSFDENVNVGTSEHPKTVSCCSCYSTSGNSIATPADCSGFNKDDLDESYFLPNRNLWKAMIGWDLLGVQAAILAALLCPYVVSFRYYFENFKKTFAVSIAIGTKIEFRTSTIRSSSTSTQSHSNVVTRYVHFARAQRWYSSFRLVIISVGT